MSKRIIIALMAALALVSCARTPRLVILHTNDTHSHLEPLRGGENSGHGGLIERAALVDSVRSAAGEDKVLLLHAGDFNQGSSYYTTFGGDAEVKAVNLMGYDCITLGNHEFDNGIEDLDARLRRLDCRIVCANIDFTPFGMDECVKPCTVIERGGMRIGIIGLAPDLKSVVSKTVSDRIPMYDNIEVTNRWASYLREEEQCDLVILLSHIGYREDMDLVPQTHGLDFVIGGHSHTFVDDVVKVNDADGKPVGVVTDGCWGLEMGELRIY